MSNIQGPMTLEAMRFRMGKTKEAEDSPAITGRPAGLWKSLASGSMRKLRFDGDHIYIEVLLSEQMSNAGGARIGEVVKSGTTYVGVIHTTVVCQFYHDWLMKWDTNRFTLDDRIELTSVAPNRIEGRILAIPPEAKLQCNKSRFDKKPVWQSFVWIPEE